MLLSPLAAFVSPSVRIPAALGAAAAPHHGISGQGRGPGAVPLR